MMAAFDITSFLPGIISAVFGGSLVAGVVALYKVRPEAGQIVVSAAQGALLVQTGVIDNLKLEIKRLNDELVALKAQLADRDQQIMKLQMQIINMQSDQSRHDGEIKDLQNPKN